MGKMIGCVGFICMFFTVVLLGLRVFSPAPEPKTTITDERTEVTTVSAPVSNSSALLKHGFSKTNVNGIDGMLGDVGIYGYDVKEVEVSEYETSIYYTALNEDASAVEVIVSVSNKDKNVLLILLSTFDQSEWGRKTKIMYNYIDGGYIAYLDKEHMKIIPYSEK